MLRIAVREILVLLLCLTAFLVVLALVLFQTGALNSVLQDFALEMPTGSQGMSGTSLMLWFKFFLKALSTVGGLMAEMSVSLWLKLLAPYLVLQAIRAYLWGQRTLAGRQWGHLYFFVISVLVFGWSIWQSGDLFYFMYALGDMPAELLQFMELESTNLLTAAVSLVLAVHCFRVFLNPARNAPKSISAIE